MIFRLLCDYFDEETTFPWYPVPPRSEGANVADKINVFFIFNVFPRARRPAIRTWPMDSGVSILINIFCWHQPSAWNCLTKQCISIRHGARQVSQTTSGSYISWKQTSRHQGLCASKQHLSSTWTHSGYNYHSETPLIIHFKNRKLFFSCCCSPGQLFEAQILWWCQIAFPNVIIQLLSNLKYFL